jgi:streptomycin 6-kinase
MLLERFRPGMMLVGLAKTDDDAATRIGAQVMRKLWRPVPDGPAGNAFEPIAAWFARAFAKHRAEYGGPGPFPAAVLERAESLATDLLASAPSTVLLHGDYHHYNVLSAERAPWLAIDPKGMTGDPGYEVGPFLLNPHHWGIDDRPERARRRLDILAEELSYDRARLRDWGIAHAVLSACWSAEGYGQEWRPAIAAAETLIGLR